MGLACSIFQKFSSSSVGSSCLKTIVHQPRGQFITGRAEDPVFEAMREYLVSPAATAQSVELCYCDMFLTCGFEKLFQGLIQSKTVQDVSLSHWSYCRQILRVRGRTLAYLTTARWGSPTLHWNGSTEGYVRNFIVRSEGSCCWGTTNPSQSLYNKSITFSVSLCP